MFRTMINSVVGLPRTTLIAAIIAAGATGTAQAVTMDFFPNLQYPEEETFDVERARECFLFICTPKNQTARNQTVDLITPQTATDVTPE